MRDLLVDIGAGAEVVELDLYAAALAEADPAAEKARLVTGGFARGVSSTLDDAFVAVYEFSRPEGARRYLLDGYDALVAQGGSVKPFHDGFAARARDGDGFEGHVFALVQDRYHILVVTGSSARTAEIATRQTGALRPRAPLEGGSPQL